ncbi:hypothetical protein MIND_00375800 [Mycena indigotica]|uniref:Mid2 domain-containing protein n=1 Tax=Mycena indigotica TaxID=2126181 RepID=A0A8H6WF08_9AGAR|nr:uncharacterized protein MIND_00375800 [Mycena indigotica]KAF7310029.1 hypothetical protein MIND_00375800 [Mycena indigotica]
MAVGSTGNGSNLTLLSLYLLVFLSLLARITPSSANIITRTIDDTDGDSETGAVPSYSPPNHFSLNSNCPDCTYHPDAGKSFKNTWHDTSQVDGQVMSVSFSFTGTSVSIFCTLVNRQSSATPLGATHLALMVDGASHGVFDHSPDGSADFAYQQQVFHVPNLANVQHNVVLSTNNAQGSYMAFDYASYTFDDGVNPNPPPPPPPTGKTTTDTTTVVSTATATGPGQTTTKTQTDISGNNISVSNGASPSSATPPGSPAGSTDSRTAISTPVKLLGSGTSSILTAPSSPSSTNPVIAASGSSSKKQHTSIAAVVAGVLAGLVGILLVVLAVVLCRRKQKRQQESTDMTQARPLPLALSRVGDGGQEYHAQLSVAGNDALIPELHYGRAGVGDPEKAALRQSLSDLRLNGSRPQLHHQASVATFATGSSLTVGGSGSQTRLTGSHETRTVVGQLPDQLVDDDLEYYDEPTLTNGTLNATAASTLSRAPTFRSWDFHGPPPATPPPGYERTDSMMMMNPSPPVPPLPAAFSHHDLS